MRTKTATLIPTLITLFFFWSGALAACQTRHLILEDLARTALQGSTAEANEAGAALREAGPAGMEAMLATGASGNTLDRICGVRDCADIRLFWYTDLEAAKTVALAAGKPILSLRLMGRLDEEFSCANSRFFRTAFYKNREIHQLLQDRFILHWRSVRPVPKVTIDFGDGSRLERTLTGNSIHYVLDSRGRLLEALPGLYGPQAFQSALERTAEASRTAAGLDDARFIPWVTARHREQLKERARALPGDLQTLAPADLARSKSAVEQPILEALDVSDDQLHELARLRRPDVRLDAASRAFLLSKQGVTDTRQAERLVEAFEATLTEDEAINEYRLGPEILKKLSDPQIRRSLDLEAFNQWVYEEVFQTPLSDPWLGLAPDDVYVALPESTRIEAPRPQG